MNDIMKLVRDINWRLGKIYKGTNLDGTSIYFIVIEINDTEIYIKIIKDYDTEIKYSKNYIVDYALNMSISTQSGDCFLINAKEVTNTKEKEELLAKAI